MNHTSKSQISLTNLKDSLGTLCITPHIVPTCPQAKTRKPQKIKITPSIHDELTPPLVSTAKKGRPFHRPSLVVLIVILITIIFFFTILGVLSPTKVLLITTLGSPKEHRGLPYLL